MIYKRIWITFSLIALLMNWLSGFLIVDQKFKNGETPNSFHPNIMANSNVEFVGSQIGGSFNAVFVKDHHAYLGIGKNLVVLNIVDPENYFVEGTVREFDNEISQVFVDQDLVYVTDYYQLWIIDIHNLTQPAVLGTYKTPEGCAGVYEISQVAYITCKTTLYALDVSNPSLPALLGKQVLPNSAFWIDRIKGIGNYLYIANHEGGLVIVDVSDPSAMQIAGTWSGGDSYGRVDDVFVVSKGEKTLAFLATPYKGLVVVDVTTPENIILLGSLYISYPEQIFVQGNFAYIAYGQGLEIVNVVNPASPVEVKSFPTSGMAFNIFLDGNLALLTSYSGGLDLVDITNPNAPKMISTYYEPVWTLDVIAQNGFAYTAGENGLGIYNVKDPYNPIFTGSYNTQGMISLQILGKNIYMGGLDGKFRIVNIENPKEPVLIGAYTDTAPLFQPPACDPPPPGFATPSIPAIPDFAVQGQTVYLANGHAGIRVLNISDPKNIKDLGAYKGENWVFVSSIEVVGTTAYILDGGCWSLSGALRILDLSDPAHPSFVGSLPIPKMGYDLEIQGELAYVSVSYLEGDTDGLYVIDMHDPRQPQQVGFLPVKQVEDIYIQGNLLYMAAGSLGLQVVDISDPGNPKIIGSYSAIGAHGVYHQGCVTYLAQWGYGMTLVGYQGDGEECSISGVVEDQFGKPVPGVEIETNSGQSVTTDQNGAYNIAGLSANSYQLTPSLQTNAFFPNQRQIKVATNITGQNFIMAGGNRVFLPLIKK